MKKLILSLTAMLCGLTVLSAKHIDFPGSDGAMTGICVVELATGKTIISHNDGKLFIPASVLKCVTSAAAVEALSPSSPLFTTRVEAFGTVRDRVLHGNVVVTGGGDPTLDSRHLGLKSRFVDTVADWVVHNDVDSITGDVIVVPELYPALGVSPYWLLEDIAWEYGAGLYGFNWHDNSFMMTVSETGVEAVSPVITDLEVISEVKRGSRGDVMAMRGEDSCRLYIYGTMTGDKYSSRYSMPFPHLVFRDALVETLSKRGIGCGEEAVETDEVSSMTPLLWVSPLRDEILRVMMFKSDNLYAEGVLRALTASGANHSVDKALAMQKMYLEGIGLDFKGMKIVDGSGLAVTNRVSPAFLARMLKLMNGGKNARIYRGLFPRVGKEGTVKSMLSKTRLNGRLSLKSGSMSGVLCYAGYKLDTAGVPTHAVVIMVNGFTCRGAEVRKAIENYLLTIF